MTTKQYISAALISGAMFMCGFGVHAAYASTEAVDKTCWCGNAFFCLMDSVADEEPLLWAKVESSPEWQEFATAYDRGEGQTEAKAVWEYLCEQDTTGYVADCLSGCDEYTEWMESY